MNPTNALDFATDEAVDRLIVDGAFANPNHLNVTAAKVRDVMRLIDASPIVEQITDWRDEDRDTAAGGRPAAMDDRAVIGLLILAANARDCRAWR